ncbi:MAG: hypothetical protein KME30_08765 [Iphinoe sp. HA4291-MV1]|jgi:hypothetical protein|nr:hypothetical protein [Iphinoe sp. HA4291-MV1]
MQLHRELVLGVSDRFLGMRRSDRFIIKIDLIGQDELSFPLETVLDTGSHPQL